MTVALFLLAACSASACEVLVTRANPGVHLPVWWGQPPRYPTKARVVRGLAGGSAILAAITLDDHVAWWWGVVLVVGAFLPAFFYRLHQNSRETVRSAR